MDNAFFERLLYEEENATLDFKRDQYRFANASAEEKSELLKDILGFVNAWRRSEAYILVGVEDVRGGRGNVIGLQPNEHLDDHSLQQFVNSLTNRPIRFHYEAFGFDGKQVGIICIEDQPRPAYLKQDYGKLKRNAVYVRRGSSTDPTKPATPEEIAQMALAPVPTAAELLVEFAALGRDDALGDKLSWDAEFVEMPEAQEIPDLERQRTRHPLGIDFSAVDLDPFNRINSDFFRELATFEFCRRLYRPIRLVVRNVGQVAARNVRCELTVPATIGVHIAYPSDIPDPPLRRSRMGLSPALRNFQPAFNRSPGDVTIERNEERYRLEVDCGDLQPGRRVWSGEFLIGKAATGDFQLVGQVLAENLAQPKVVTLSISIDIARTAMTVDDLLNLSETGDHAKETN